MIKEETEKEEVEIILNKPEMGIPEDSKILNLKYVRSVFIYPFGEENIIMCIPYLKTLINEMKPIPEDTWFLKFVKKISDYTKVEMEELSYETGPIFYDSICSLLIDLYEKILKNATFFELDKGIRNFGNLHISNLRFCSYLKQYFHNCVHNGIKEAKYISVDEIIFGKEVPLPVSIDDLLDLEQFTSLKLADKKDFWKKFNRSMLALVEKLEEEKSVKKL